MEKGKDAHNLEGSNVELPKEKKKPPKLLIVLSGVFVFLLLLSRVTSNDEGRKNGERNYDQTNEEVAVTNKEDEESNNEELPNTGNTVAGGSSTPPPESNDYEVVVNSQGNYVKLLPEDVLIFDSSRDYSNAHQIYRMNSDGSNVQMITNNENHDHFFAKISPDRTQILFHRSNSGGNGNNFEEASIWVMDIDGKNMRQIRKPAADYGWTLQGHAEWSPDGTEIALTGGSGGTNDHFNIHIIDVSNGNLKRTLTNFQTGAAIDPSWSPDGQRIIFSGCDSFLCFPLGLDIYSVPASGGAIVQHTNDDKAEYDPYISPDGNTVAWLVLDVPLFPPPLGQWGIKTAPWNKSGSFDDSWIIRDGNVNSKPEWSASSQHIYTHRIVYSSPSQFQLWRMNRDGSNLIKLESGTTDGRSQHIDIQ